MTPNTNTLYPSHERGSADHGWLKAKHTFSFSSYYDRNKMNFGAIRVLNDDTIAPGMGFGEHPHDNMEIITIPLEGSLKHKDSTGQEGVILPGEVQIMSAGHGILHSEFNPSPTETTKLFQIWLLTAQENAEPRYAQKKFWDPENPPKSIEFIEPHQKDGALSILQDARFEMHWLDQGESFTVDAIAANRGIFIMVVEGEVQLDNQTLGKRDAIGLVEDRNYEVLASSKAQVLAIHTPLVR